jgi:IS30 family transposase
MYEMKNCGECKVMGDSFCRHAVNKQILCKVCDPQEHLKRNVSSRMHNALKANKDKGILEHLGCDISTFRNHISEQFEKGMTWNNYGEWEIDHIIPIKYKNPTIEEVVERLHYGNTQPMWKSENMEKGNRFVGRKEKYVSDFVKFEKK